MLMLDSYILCLPFLFLKQIEANKVEKLKSQWNHRDEEHKPDVERNLEASHGSFLFILRKKDS